jgi:hypothetical protein
MLYATDYRDVDGIIIPTTRRGYAWQGNYQRINGSAPSAQLARRLWKLKDRLAKETRSPVVWVTAILAMLFAWIDVKGEPKNVALSIWRCAVCIDNGEPAISRRGLFDSGGTYFD